MEIDERKIVFQNEDISYEEAYILNHAQLISSEALLELIASLLYEIIEETDKIRPEVFTSFHGRSYPNINILDYLKRISKCSNCSQECFLIALIYIDRITDKNRETLLSSLTVHRLLITSVMIAAKFYDDRYYNNDYYSKVGGISNQEINQLEREFLHLLNFKLYISPCIFFSYRQRLLIQDLDNDTGIQIEQQQQQQPQQQQQQQQN